MHFDSTIEELSCSKFPMVQFKKSRTYLTCSITSEPLGLVDTKQEVWLSLTEASLCMAVTDPSNIAVAQSTKDIKRLPSTEDKPTLPELISFKTRTSMNRIGTHYREQNWNTLPWSWSYAILHDEMEQSNYK